MVDPLSALATAITTLILPKALEKLGDKLGEVALAKSGEAINTTRQIVQEKLQAAGKARLLVRAEEKPTDSNVQFLQAELVGQMEEDQAFAGRLQELVNQIQTQSPQRVQEFLDRLQVKGNTEIGNIDQLLEGETSGKQSAANDVKVGGNLKIGSVTQRQSNSGK